MLLYIFYPTIEKCYKNVMCLLCWWVKDPRYVCGYAQTVIAISASSEFQASRTYTLNWNNQIHKLVFTYFEIKLRYI